MIKELLSLPASMSLKWFSQIVWINPIALEVRNLESINPNASAAPESNVGFSLCSF